MDISQLKAILKEKKITYEKLSSLSGIPLNTLKNIFRGKTINPRIDTMQAIENALGINSGLSFLSLRDQNIKQESSLTMKEKQLLNAFNELIPPMQDYILDMVEKLVLQPQNSTKKFNNHN